MNNILYTSYIGTDVIKVYNENKEKSLISLYDYITKRIGNRVYGTSADYVHIDTKKRKWYSRHRGITVIGTYNCKSRNNINKKNKDLWKIKSNISSQLNTLINNYIKVFEPYLNEYVNYSQTLYTNIYNYYQAQINNNQNVKNIMDKYNQVFDDMMNNIEDNIIKNNNFKFDTEFDSCLNNFEKNINELQENYYKNFYLKNYEDFLEYPDEIQFKIDKYKDELNESVDNIKAKIKISYQQRINNVLKETKNFIQDIHDFNYQYIMINLNNFNPNEEYYNIKKKYNKRIFYFLFK